MIPRELVRKDGVVDVECRLVVAELESISCRPGMDGVDQPPSLGGDLGRVSFVVAGDAAHEDERRDCLATDLGVDARRRIEQLFEALDCVRRHVAARATS